MIQEISVRELAHQLTQRAPLVLLDVRNPNEHAFARLSNSQLIPLPELPDRWNEIQVAKDATLVVYCHHGVRSRIAAEILMRHGVRHVVSLAGGIDAWSLEIDPTIPRY